MSSIDQQVGGDQYKGRGIQPVEYAESNDLRFLEACVVKRVTRHNRPGGKGRQDIEKAIHELQLLLELRYAASEGAIDVTALDDVGKWYAWTPGCGMPLPSPETMVRVRLKCGEDTGFAKQVRLWGWEDCGPRSIVAYQIVDDGHSATPAPEVTELEPRWVITGVRPETGRRIRMRNFDGLEISQTAEVTPWFQIPPSVEFWCYAD